MHARRRSLARCASDGECPWWEARAVAGVAVEVAEEVERAVRIRGGNEFLPAYLA